MKIAIPTASGKLFAHFGKCSHFALVNVDTTSSTILDKEIIAAPPHEPGKLPHWLKSHGVTTIIAGGIGESAASLCRGQGIQVVAGAPPELLEDVLIAWLNGKLVISANMCSHGDDPNHAHAHQCGHHHD